MYPFYVNNKKIFSFSYKPEIGDVIKEDVSGKWYKILSVGEKRSRKVYGKETFKR